jgi:hypothetical protein
MATQDNAFTATGTRIPLPPTADFLASTGTRSVRHGFLTAGRFSTGGSFSGRITGLEGKSVNRVGVFGQTEEPEIPFTQPVSAGVFGAGKTGGRASLGGRQSRTASWALRTDTTPFPAGRTRRPACSQSRCGQLA